MGAKPLRQLSEKAEGYDLRLLLLSQRSRSKPLQIFTHQSEIINAFKALPPWNSKLCRHPNYAWRYASRISREVYLRPILADLPIPTS